MKKWHSTLFLQNFVKDFNRVFIKESPVAARLEDSNDQDRKTFLVKLPNIQKQSDSDYEVDYPIQVEPNEESSMVEEHVEWEYEDRYEDRYETEDVDISGNEDTNQPTNPFEPPKKRARLRADKDPTLEVHKQQILIVTKPISNDPETSALNPPHKFPLRTAEQVHEMEAWLNLSPKHHERVVNLVRRKLYNTPIHQAVKKCFDYEIVEHFWHPKGQRRPGGTSITELRLFTDVFEKAIDCFDELDLDLLFRLFFKNARNCLRARRSRERSRTTEISHTPPARARLDQSLSQIIE